jgi:hypothetical protein
MVSVIDELPQDRRVYDQYFKVMEAVEFGFAVLLASIQTIIGKGWREPKFVETFTIMDSPPGS